MAQAAQFIISEFTNPSGEIVFRVTGWLDGKRIRKNFPTRAEASAERQALEIQRLQAETGIRTTATRLPVLRARALDDSHRRAFGFIRKRASTRRAPSRRPGRFPCRASRRRGRRRIPSLGRYPRRPHHAPLPGAARPALGRRLVHAATRPLQLPQHFDPRAQGQLPDTGLGCCTARSLAVASRLVLFQRNEKGASVTGFVDRTRFGLLC